MHPSVWSHKCIFKECGGCVECRSFRGPSAPPSIPLHLTADTSDLEPFFASFGVARLPLLAVEYTQEEKVLGALTRYTRESDKFGGGEDMLQLRHAPKITWNGRLVERGMVIMMDIDAGGRASVDGAQPGALGPYVQAVWTECTGGTVEQCRKPHMLPYHAPDVRQGTDRIAFLLLRQPKVTWLRGLSKTPFVLNLTAFLHDNYDDDARRSAAVAWNFFYLSGSEPERDLNPRRWPPWDEPPPLPPPLPPWRAPDGPSPPPQKPAPAPPEKTWWGGFGDIDKRAWEH